MVSDGTGVSLTSSLGNTMTIDDAQIRMSGAGVGLVFSVQTSASAFLRARFLTVRGDGTANSVGVASQGATVGTLADVTLEDSIVAGFDHALRCDPGSGQARLAARFSAFDPGDLVQRCAAAIDASTGNVASDPQLVPAANGDLLLAEISPAIDAGDPAQSAPSPATDLAGDARLVDGNRDGTARVDMGAFEYAPRVVEPPPGVRPRPLARLAVTRFRIAPASFAPVPHARRGARRSASRGLPHGATFRFHLSREATVAIRVSVLRRARRGRRLVAVLRRTLRRAFGAGDARLRFDGRDGRGHALAPGRYRATIAARDGFTTATARAVTFAIVAP